MFISVDVGAESKSLPVQNGNLKKRKRGEKEVQASQCAIQEKWLFKISKRIYIYDSALKVSIPSTNLKMFGPKKMLIMRCKSMLS